MSAYMVSKEHIDAIVYAAYEGPKDNGRPSGYGRQTWYRPGFKGNNGENQVDFHNLDELGKLLVKENLSSIHARYPDTIADPKHTPGPCDQYWLQPYTWTRPTRRLNAVEALKALACYEYQSCEHQEWESSAARQFCESLRHALIGCLPGYDEAEWGVAQ